MKLPELIIVAKAELAELHEKSRLWWLGWAFAGLAFLMSVVVLSWSTEVMYRLAEVEAGAKVQAEMLRETEAGVVRQWQEQQVTIAANIAWGKYIRERFDISSSNGPMCPTLPPRTRPRPMVAAPSVDFHEHPE